MRSRRAACAIVVVVALAIASLAVACSEKTRFSPTPTPQPEPTASVSSATPPPSATTSGAAAKPDTQYVDALQAAAAQLPADLVSGNKIGRDDAPLKMLTFVDFQCPYCLKFAATQEPTLIDEYVKTGKLQIIAQMFPIIGPESVLSAVGGQCAADQDRFWQYYDQLYIVQARAGQVSHEEQNVGRFTRDTLSAVAKDVGMDPTAFRSCLDQPAPLAAVQDSVNSGHNFGITGTPGFVINGVSHGSGAPATLDAWRTMLDKALTQTPVATPTTAGSA